MSIGEVDSIEVARKELREAIASGSTNWSKLERALGRDPTRQALKSFHDGKTDEARYWKRLLRVLRGEPDEPDLQEEAARALRLIREGQEALARVVKRMGEAGPHTLVNQEDLEAAADGDRARADLEAKIERANRRSREAGGGEK